MALIVPIEVSSRLVEAIPVVVDKVPSAAERVKREVVLARFLGKMAVDQGVREVRSRLTPGEPQHTTIEPSTRDATPAPAAVHTAWVDIPDVTTLALADYDHLSSVQIVGKLDGLDAAERTAIERYEQVGRHRRTILGKLEQLRTADA